MRIEKGKGWIEKMLGTLPEKTGKKLAFKTPLSNFVDSHRSVYLLGREIQVPVFSDIKVPESYCARYVRLAAKEIFGKDYEPADAWNLAKANKSVAKIGDESLEELSREGILTPGRVIGLQLPGSRFEMNGDYSHVALALGESLHGPLVAHKFNYETRVDSLRELELLGLIPKEIIDSKIN